MKGFIVYAGYKVADDKTYVQLAGRLENKESFASISQVTPYFFLRENDAKEHKRLLAEYEVKETKSTNFKKEPVVKVSHASQAEINKIVEILHRNKIDTFEADIKPHTRFIIDNDLRGSIEIKGESEPNERTDRIYKEPEIKPSSFVPALKVLSIDIESDKQGENLFCVGLYGEKYKQVFIITSKNLENATSCKNESDCLEKLKKAIIKQDPDIITGWNIADFDFPYLKKRCEKNSVSFDIGRDASETRMKISNNFFRDSTVNVMGRQIIDGLNLMQDPFIKEAPSVKNIKFESWTLENVSQAILGEGKTITGKNRHAEIEELYNSQNAKALQKLVNYNLQDCKLAYDILAKTKILELAVERSQLTGLQLDRITGSIAAFDSLYIRKARKLGLVSPTTRFSNKEERIKGGYVMESKPSICLNVLVLDFKSLYPSIIKTFNIDPASFIDTSEKDAIKAPNGALFRNQNGILPEIIEALHSARENAKKEHRELASYAIKTIMNSFFGVLASPNCRYFSLNMANAITHFARDIIQKTAEKITEKGYEVIYSDTDSVFINTKIENKDKARKIGEELTEHINKFYAGYIKEAYKRHSFLEIEFKRHYLSFMIPPLRATEKSLKKGSKKRYAGLIEEKGKEELEIVGLEAIRGDWTDAAQEFQEELLMKIFHKEEFVQFIKDYVKKLKEGKMDEKLVYRKSIRKSLEEYTKTTPPHVKAARQLDKMEGNIIEYYITEKGPEPLQKLKHKIDYEHYISKQIAPIANTLLFFFHRNFEDILKESKQTRLFA